MVGSWDNSYYSAVYHVNEICASEKNYWRPSLLNCNNALYNAGLPVLFVVIGLAVRHEHYGIRDDEGHLLLYVRCLHVDITIIFA